MDVVRANVEKVGGSVELESKVGVGTTLRLRVPLTLAIVPALVIRSGGKSFALPQSTLVELVYVSKREVELAVERVGTSEVYRLRGRLLPLVWLDRLLELKALVDPESYGFYVAVLEAEGCRYGLVVDDLVAPEEIVVKPLSAALREIGLFSGATVLGNGMLALILDIGAVAARAGVKPMEEELAEEKVMEIQAGAEEASFLVFEDRARERTALPLDAIERIESVPLEQIEYAGGRTLLQYRGELLPLSDDGHVLEELGDGVEQSATVLICGDVRQENKRRMGVVVRRVLDVAPGSRVEREGATAGMELVLVREKLTTVHREFQSESGHRWKEVA
jgi:two-component system chemotaxis sensor kinase CheA